MRIKLAQFKAIQLLDLNFVVQFVELFQELIPGDYEQNSKLNPSILLFWRLPLKLFQFLEQLQAPIIGPQLVIRSQLF